MTIAILGAGAMAEGLARAMARVGYDVVIGARDIEKARALAAEAGRGVDARTIQEAAGPADIVVLAVPYAAAHETLAAAGDLTGKIIVDITNPMTPDFSGLAIGHVTAAAEEIQKAAPGAHVVKAFNTIFAHLLAYPRPASKALSVFFAGDDAEANGAVRAMIERMGFKAEYVGPLRHARYLEPLAALNIAFGYALGAGVNIAPEWRRIDQGDLVRPKKGQRAFVFDLLANP